MIASDVDEINSVYLISPAKTNAAGGKSPAVILSGLNTLTKSVSNTC